MGKSFALYMMEPDFDNTDRLMAANDAVGNRTKVTGPQGRAVQYFYDHDGKFTKLIRGDLTEEPYEYGADGNLTRKVKGDGRAITYSYDAHRRLTRREYQHGSTHTFGYDALGQRTSLTDSTGRTLWSYDGVGRITFVTQPVGDTTKMLTYAYDVVGNRTSMADAESLVMSYGYDGANRLTSVSNSLF